MPRLPQQLERIHNLYDAPPPRPHTKPRRSAAFSAIIDRLTLVGQVVGKVQYANALLLGVVELLYDVDCDEEYANFDIDGRVIVALPWGSAGCYEWGVRTSEAKALRWIMMRRGEAPHPWIVYRPESKGWYVTQRTIHYPNSTLKNAPITNEEWRRAWAATSTAWARANMARG